MKVLLVNPRGFCAGVEMAIETVERSLQLFGTPLYVFHEIVHNTYIVKQLQERGVVFVDDLNQVPKGSRLIYSAHGVSPQIRAQSKDLSLKVIDATCPLVSKVHREAIRFAKEGYTILLIGHEGHDEVTGTRGEAPGQILLIETEDDVDSLEISQDQKIVYLTQTTLSVDDANRIIQRLKKRYPNIAAPPGEDICYATQNRQEAVKEILSQVNIVLVVGSHNSSNSRRLVEIAHEADKPAYLIDGSHEIRADWFRGDETVLLTAGASAPEQLVQDCTEYLSRKFHASIKEQEPLREEIAFFPLPEALRDNDLKILENHRVIPAPKNRPSQSEIRTP